MKYSCFFLLLWLVFPAAWSQQPRHRDIEAFQAPPQQWRAELRSTLKTPREPAAPVADANADQPAQAPLKPASRHLSAQERADLRQQLLQQQRETRGNRPKNQD